MASQESYVSYSQDDGAPVNNEYDIEFNMTPSKEDTTVHEVSTTSEVLSTQDDSQMSDNSELPTPDTTVHEGSHVLADTFGQCLTNACSQKCDGPNATATEFFKLYIAEPGPKAEVLTLALTRLSHYSQDPSLVSQIAESLKELVQ